MGKQSWQHGGMEIERDGGMGSGIGGEGGVRRSSGELMRWQGLQPPGSGRPNSAVNIGGADALGDGRFQG